MVGMIEQINGTGLSGVTGKAAKQGAGSLFAKLFAMFEKHADASGKGKGLQIAGMQSTKGNAQAGTALTIAGKGKHLPLVVAKQGEKNEKGETKADSAVAAAVQGGQVLLDQMRPAKHAHLAAQLAASRNMQGEQGKEQHAMLGKQGAEQGNQFQLNGKERGNQFLLNGKEQVKGKEQAKAEGKDVINDPLQGQAKTASTPAATTTAAKLESKPEKAVATTATKLEPTLKAATTETEESAAATVTTQAKKSSTVAAHSSSLETGKGKQFLQAHAAQAQPQANNTAQATRDDNAKQLAEAPRNGAELKSNVADKAKGNTDTTIAAAAQAQAKHAQAAQVQNQNNQTAGSATVATAAVQATASDNAMADSGSQQQNDEAGREARNISALSGDNRSQNAQQAASSNFQSYLSGKHAPSMTMFETIDHIAQSAHNGKTKLEIQLEPAHLGKIQVTLQTDASKQLLIHMVVDQGATRAALEQQMPALRNALAQQGFDLSGFSMGGGSQQEQMAGNDSQGSRRSFTTADNGSFATDTIQSGGMPAARSADGGLSIRI